MSGAAPLAARGDAGARRSANRCGGRCRSRTTRGPDASGVADDASETSIPAVHTGVHKTGANDIGDPVDRLAIAVAAVLVSGAVSLPPELRADLERLLQVDHIRPGSAASGRDVAASSQSQTRSRRGASQ